MKTCLFSRYPNYAIWCKMGGRSWLEISTVVVDDIFEHKTGYDMFEVKISFYLERKYNNHDKFINYTTIHSYFETHIAGEKK